MRFDFKDFQILQAVEKYGTFAKAAEHLNRTPSAVTQSIQKLEHLIGFQIFDRSEYRPQMTKEGQLFMDRGRQILKQMERLEHDLNLIQKGWESEFCIAYDDLLSYPQIYPIIKEFQKIAPSVSIRLYREVMNGSWDALSHNRVSLAIGASGEPPLGLPCAQKALGSINFVFAVAANHPLASIEKAIPKEEIALYHSVVISDTSQHLPVRSSGMISGQPILYVPDMDAKIQAQVQGLGVGYLPLHRIRHLLKKGLLLEKQVDNLKSKVQLKMAWRTDTHSQILDWFLGRFEKIHSSINGALDNKP